MKVLVAQKGPREHFLAARSFHQRRSLAALVVDWYAPAGRLTRACLAFFSGRRSQSALATCAREIPGDLIRPLRLLGLWIKWKEQSARKCGDSYAGFLATDAAFARKLARMTLPPHDVFFGYSYASLEMLEAEKSRGVFTVLDQIDPGPLHFRLVAEEMARHPELAGAPQTFPEAYFARVRREWELADVIVVNSEWTRKAIVSEGADPAKIEVLPLAYQEEDGGQRSEAGPLRVLWLGTLSLGKGIYYLIEAARKLQRESVLFTVAGPLQIRQKAIETVPANIRWLGQVPRSQTGELYAQADLFVFPTLSDGFGLTQLEALAHSLPVITTANCGRVVEDGLTGFIIPPCDSQALADAILKFVRHRTLLAEMRPRCLEAAKAFSVSRYGERLLEIIDRRMA